MGFGGHIQSILRDPEKAKAFLMSHQETVNCWGGFVALVLLVFFFFSNGDFSFLLTLSSLVGMFAFLVVVMKVESEKTAKGVSLKMMECYMCVCLGRLCAIVPFEGYLPFDSSGDWLYQLVEVITFCLAGSIVYMCRFRYQGSYDPSCDTLNHFYLIAPCAVFALLFHPSLNAFMPSDIAWAFALYLESVAVLPQLFMFQRAGQVEPWTAHFLAAQAVAKLISFIFWATSYTELSDPDHPLKSHVGNWVMLMQLVQICVMGDFIYHYVRCLKQGIPISLLLHAENV